MKDQHKLKYADRTKVSWPSKSREYRTWERIKRCCYEPTYHHYKHYGARGIRVCQRWLDSFQNFLDDMGEKPQGMSIGRINNDGDYEPKNCRWETGVLQCRNRRITVRLERDGIIRPLAEWAGILDVSWQSLYDAVRLDYPLAAGFRRVHQEELKEGKK